MSTAALQYAAALQETGCTPGPAGSRSGVSHWQRPPLGGAVVLRWRPTRKWRFSAACRTSRGRKVAGLPNRAGPSGAVPPAAQHCGPVPAAEAKGSREGLCLLRCARDPGDQALAPVAQFLCKKHGYQAITFEIVVDPEVLGGFVLEIDGVTHDKSVRGQLQALAQSLQKG